MLKDDHRAGGAQIGHHRVDDLLCCFTHGVGGADRLLKVFHMLQPFEAQEFAFGLPALHRFLKCDRQVADRKAAAEGRLEFGKDRR